MRVLKNVPKKSGNQSTAVRRTRALVRELEAAAKESDEKGGLHAKALAIAERRTQRGVPPERLTEALQRRAEQLLEKGPIDFEGARTLISLALAGELWSPDMLDVMESLAEHGNEDGKRALEGFARDTHRHIQTRARGCSMIDLRAARDVRALALRDGKLDEREVEALVGLMLHYPFTAGGKKVIAELLKRVPLGAHRSYEKKWMVEAAMAAWAKLRSPPAEGERNPDPLLDRKFKLTITPEDVERMKVVLDLGGFSKSDRSNFLELKQRADFTPEASAALDTLLARPAMGDPAEWTIFIHMNADSDLERHAIADLEEIESVGPKLGAFNVVALIDAGGRLEKKHLALAPPDWRSGTRLVWITRDEHGRIARREIPLDEKSELGLLHDRHRGHLDLTDPEVLRAAVSFAQNFAPSKHFLLNLWGHGLPWKGGRSPTDQRFTIGGGGYGGNVMSAVAIETALKGLKIDIVSCDSCSMASAEMGQAMGRAGVGSVVASEAVVYSGGFGYRDLLTRLAARFDEKGTVSPEEMAKLVVDNFGDAGGLARGRLNQTMSATDLKNAPKLWKAIDSFAELLIAAGGFDGNQDIRECYINTGDIAKHQIDLGVFARKILRRFKSKHDLGKAAAALLETIKEVCYSRSNSFPWIEGDDARHSEPPPRKMTKEGRQRQNQWFSLPHKVPTGLTIYGPWYELEPEYRDPASAWADSAWLRFLEGVVRRPVNQDEHYDLWQIELKEMKDIAVRRKQRAKPAAPPPGPKITPKKARKKT